MRDLVAAAVLSCATLASAGPLTPPPGAVTPTGKTIQEAEPRIVINAENTPGDAGSIFIIAQPGSYYLTGNITSSSGQTAISVTADNVTIDLNGFSLIGANPEHTGIELVDADNAQIRNGTIRGWFHGINATSGDRRIYENLFLVENSGHGLIAGDQSVGVDCVAQGNAFSGIFVSQQSSVTRCTSVENGSDGFFALSGSTLSGCVADLNGAEGFDCSAGCTLIGCIARLNAEEGFDAFNSTTLRDCTAERNTLAGFDVGRSSVITGCTARGNGLRGFRADFDSQISGSVAYENEGDGFSSGGSTLITGCTANNNLGSGIAVSVDCRVVNNLCDGNGSWGIVGLSDTTVDSNTVTDNGPLAAGAAGGISCRFGLIIRNTVTGNAGTEIATDNTDFGPIVTAVGEITSTNPWANIVY